MTTLSLHDAAEQVWTCDESGNWFQQPRVRIRSGNGWLEIPVAQSFDDILAASREAGQHVEGRAAE